MKLTEQQAATMARKSMSDRPTAVIGRNQWDSIMENPTFGRQTVVNIHDPETGNFRYQGSLLVETPGAINIVARESDMAIGFIEKYRERALPDTPTIRDWRDAQNLDIFKAPQLGMDFIEIPRGWISEIDEVITLQGHEMHEGTGELGWTVNGFQEVGSVYPNSAVCATFLPVFFGKAVERTARTTEDEAADLKEVIWMTPAEVIEWQASPMSCGLSLAAVAKVRAFGRNHSNDKFLRQLANAI